MFFEHLIYSTAIAIIAGMIWYKRTGRDPSWIIIASAYAPDFDIVAGEMFKKLDMNILFDGAPIRHGDFHNIAFLLLFACAAALALRLAGMRFGDSFLFAGIGFGAHIFEDVLVFYPFYTFFSPISEQKFGIGLFDYKPDLFFIADSRVLYIGLFLVLCCAYFRSRYEGNSWIKKDMKALGIIFLAWILIIPALGVLDISITDSAMFSKDGIFLEGWELGDNTSWDSTIYHEGNHSGKIEILGNKSTISGNFRSKLIRVKPNTNYTFSIWGKTEGAGGSNTPAITIIELDNNKESISPNSRGFGKGTNEWIKKIIIFKSKNNTQWLYLNANIWNGYGTFWIDDIELYEDGIDENLISNGGFEKGEYFEIIEFERLLKS